MLTGYRDTIGNLSVSELDELDKKDRFIALIKLLEIDLKEIKERI